MQTLRAERGLSPGSGAQTEVSARSRTPCPEVMAPTVGAHPALHPQLGDTLALSQLNWEGWNHPQELKLLPQQTKFSQDGTLRTQHLQGSKPTGAILMPFLKYYNHLYFPSISGLFSKHIQINIPLCLRDDNKQTHRGRFSLT